MMALCAIVSTSHLTIAGDLGFTGALFVIIVAKMTITARVMIVARMVAF
jgi:hypothetical protein